MVRTTSADVRMAWVAASRNRLRSSTGTWSPIWLACHAFVVGYEEPALRRSFGAEFSAFCANVPRWIPRARPWQAP